MGGLQSAGRAVYRGYLKPSLAGNSINDARQIVQTAMDEWLPLSKGGKEKAEQIIGDLKGQVDRILKAKEAVLNKVPGGKIDLHDIAESVRQFARDHYYKPGRPVEDFEAAFKIADNIDAHPTLQGATETGLTKANETKRALGESIGDRNFGMERGPSVEAEKHGRYALRKELEAKAPSIGPLNARESKLIDAARAIHRAVEREANQSMSHGVKTLVAGAGGLEEYRRTGDPWTAAAKTLVGRAVLSPEVFSRLALLTYRIGKLPGVAPASAARLAFAVLSENQAQDEQE